MPPEVLPCILLPEHIKQKADGIIGIAPFKDNIPPYGWFANTTECNVDGKEGNEEFFIKQTTYADGTELPATLNSPITWKCSETAYHGQKLLYYRQQLAKDFNKTKELNNLDLMIKELAEMPRSPNTVFLPKDYETLVNQYIGTFGFKNKTKFDDDCNAGYHPKRKSEENAPNLDKQNNNLPYTYNYMKFVIKLKLEQHPELKEQAMNFARLGIMPIEISRHDRTWASFTDGTGLNYLGIIILELGNEFLTTHTETPKVTNPRDAYKKLTQQAPGAFGHTVLQGYVNNNGSGKAYVDMPNKVSTDPAKPALVEPDKPLIPPKKIEHKIQIYCAKPRNPYSRQKASDAAQKSDKKKVIGLNFNTKEEAEKFKQDLLATSTEQKDNLEKIIKIYPTKPTTLYIESYVLNPTEDKTSRQYIGAYKAAKGELAIDFGTGCENTLKKFVELTSLPQDSYNTYDGKPTQIYFKPDKLNPDPDEGTIKGINIPYPAAVVAKENTEHSKYWQNFVSTKKDLQLKATENNETVTIKNSTDKTVAIIKQESPTITSMECPSMDEKTYTKQALEPVQVELFIGFLQQYKNSPNTVTIEASNFLCKDLEALLAKTKEIFKEDTNKLNVRLKLPDAINDQQFRNLITEINKIVSTSPEPTTKPRP